MAMVGLGNAPCDRSVVQDKVLALFPPIQCQKDLEDCSGISALEYLHNLKVPIISYSVEMDPKQYKYSGSAID